MNLRFLLENPKQEVVRQARVLLSLAERLDFRPEELLDRDIDSLVNLLVRASGRHSTPDEGSGLSKIKAALCPLLDLHRTVHLLQPLEEQLEPSESDIVSFGVTRADLDTTANELGCVHLGGPAGPQPAQCIVHGVKNRVLAVRTLQILRNELSVAFIVDRGSPVTYICHDTLRAFGVDPASKRSKFIRGTFEGGVTLDLYLFDPEGPHNDLNVLGMDYLMASNCTLEISGRSRSVKLSAR